VKHLDKIFVLPLILLVSCHSADKSTTSIPSDWKELRLKSNWTLSIPERFDEINKQGVDSQPGEILSETDSITLQYDSGYDLYSKDTCDVNFQIKRANKKIQLYDSLYRGQKITIDTINDRISILVTPVKNSKGIMKLSIRDCESGAWLSLMTKVSNDRQELLIREIFNTVDYKIDGHK
jgi:hypothetical protein